MDVYQTNTSNGSFSLYLSLIIHEYPSTKENNIDSLPSLSLYIYLFLFLYLYIYTAGSVPPSSFVLCRSTDCICVVSQILLHTHTLITIAITTCMLFCTFFYILCSGYSPPFLFSSFFYSPDSSPPISTPQTELLTHSLSQQCVTVHDHHTHTHTLYTQSSLCLLLSFPTTESCTETSTQSFSVVPLGHSLALCMHTHSQRPCLSLLRCFVFLLHPCTSSFSCALLIPFNSFHFLSSQLNTHTQHRGFLIHGVC